MVCGYQGWFVNDVCFSDEYNGCLEYRAICYVWKKELGSLLSIMVIILQIII